MTEQRNYQPQTGDTTNGPNIHTYIPRSDGTITIGGIIYTPQTAIPIVTTPLGATPVAPVLVTTAAPTVVTPVATATVSSAPAIQIQSQFTPPGGPSVPTGQIGYSVHSILPHCYPFALYSHQHSPYYLHKASRFLLKPSFLLLVSANTYLN